MILISLGIISILIYRTNEEDNLFIKTTFIYNWKCSSNKVEEVKSQLKRQIFTRNTPSE